MASSSSSVSLRRLDVTIDDANVEPGMLEVMQVLRPEWKSEDIKFKVDLKLKQVFYVLDHLDLASFMMKGEGKENILRVSSID